MEEEFLKKYYSLPLLERLFASLPKAQVNSFMKRVKDLETSLWSAFTMEFLTMNLQKYFMMG